jgi:glycosyltransferase involved in cell wall biosynthesis
MTRTLSAALRLLRRHLANTRGNPRDLARLARRSLALLLNGGWWEIVERQGIVANLHSEYPQWRACGAAADAAAIARAAGEFAGRDHAPKVSVLMPTRNASVSWLSAAIASVEAQHYPHWQLCIVDDGSQDQSGLELAQARAAVDPRIVVQALPAARGIAAATNAAMAMANGSVLSFLDHDDLLAPEALLLVARAYVQMPELELLYSDEDKIDGNGEHYWPSFKPAWNPDLLLANNYITHLVAVRADLARRVGGLRPESDGAQDWDFVLRATEAVASTAIGHLPRVLYHWRAVPGSTAAQAGNKPWAADAQRRVLESAMQRRGIAGRLERGAHSWRVRRDVAGAPLVSIVIPVRDRADLLQRCLHGVATRSPGTHVEIIVVDNGSTEASALELLVRLAATPGHRVLRAPGAFNFSKLANAGVRDARGNVVVLLNNDTVPLDADWLPELLAQASRPEVGAVGAALYYPGAGIQHVGIVLGVNGTGDHFYRGMPRDWSGINGRVQSIQDLSVVTAACIAFRKASFDAVGGMDESLAVSQNDADFCLRLRARGYRVLWTPYARLEHAESASRGYDHDPARIALREHEAATFTARWPAWLADDPAYNPNLARSGRAFGLGTWIPFDDIRVRVTRQEPSA